MVYTDCMRQPNLSLLLSVSHAVTPHVMTVTQLSRVYILRVLVYEQFN